MKADLFNALAEYNSRANNILMSVASKLTAEEFANTPSRESAKTLLLHLFVVEAAYYARCRGDEFNFDVDAVRSFHDVLQLAAETVKSLQRLIDSLKEGDYDREVTSTFGDESLHLPMCQMLLHTFMHTARHRGELSIILSQLGYPLPNPDLIVQFVDQSNQTWSFERA